MLGRTGNNLFQYAFGRVLSAKLGVPLVMDGCWFDRAGWRGVSCLRRLPILAEVRRTASVASRALLKLRGRHPWECLGIPVVSEDPRDHRFNPRYFEAPRRCLVKGYFQSPRYFEGIGPELRRELEMEGLPWPAATRRLADEIRTGLSVAVHVRRSDYLGNPDVEVCDVGYFMRAMSLMRSRHEGACFHVFSDDPGWCAKELAGNDVKVHRLPGAEGDPLHDLFLMSLARHHIISNSSYSWWAAWLAARPGQQVMVPDPWYASGIIAPVVEKLLPGWETLAAGPARPPGT